jgi:hypothetical protein
MSEELKQEVKPEVKTSEPFPGIPHNLLTLEERIGERFENLLKLLAEHGIHAR